MRLACRFLVGAMLGGLLLAGPAPRASAQTVGCAAPLQPWTQISLYFGRDIPGGGTVSGDEFNGFLDDTVTPRFPDGLTVMDVTGQYRYDNGTIVREPSKLVILFVPDAAAAGPKVDAIIAEYKKRFRQESVAREQEVDCIGFQ